MLDLLLNPSLWEGPVVPLAVACHCMPSRGGNRVDIWTHPKLSNVVQSTFISADSRATTATVLPSPLISVPWCSTSKQWCIPISRCPRLQILSRYNQLKIRSFASEADPTWLHTYYQACVIKNEYFTHIYTHTHHHPDAEKCEMKNSRRHWTERQWVWQKSRIDCKVPS